MAGTQTGKDVKGSAAAVARKDKEKEVEKVRLANAAHCEMYVCFEGPLGAHLKQNVREKIWKDEFVEFFPLLPLEHQIAKEPRWVPSQSGAFWNYFLLYWQLNYGVRLLVIKKCGSIAITWGWCQLSTISQRLPLR